MCSLFVSLLLLSNIVVNAADKPKFGGVLKVAITANPAYIDPPCAQSGSMREVVHQVFEELVSVDQNFKIVPMLAKDFQVSPDGKIYTFKLRNGVKFHNGKEMTSKDVIASIERAQKVSYDTSGIDQIESMTATDNYTVVITLKKMSSIFLLRLATERLPIAIMPKEVIEGVAARELKDEQLIGTGPFMLKEWVRDRYIKLDRFKDYSPIPGLPPSGLGGGKTAYLDEFNAYPNS